MAHAHTDNQSHTLGQNVRKLHLLLQPAALCALPQCLSRKRKVMALCGLSSPAWPLRSKSCHWPFKRSDIRPG